MLVSLLAEAIAGGGGACRPLLPVASALSQLADAAGGAEDGAADQAPKSKPILCCVDLQ